MIDILAERIVRRVSAMCSWNGIDEWREIQLDCDWTKSTQIAFYKLCKEVKRRVGKRLVSSTIRLHQLTFDAPPVDYGVLMVYNTDRFNDIKTRNSILNPNTVRTYLMKKLYTKIPLDMALPIFQWDIVFRDGTFARISKSHGGDLTRGDTVRHEQVDIRDIVYTQKLLYQYLNLERNGYCTILYHLDSVNIKTYRYQECLQQLAWSCCQRKASRAIIGLPHPMTTIYSVLLRISRLTKMAFTPLIKLSRTVV